MLKGTVQGDIVPSVIFSYKSIPQLNPNPKDVIQATSQTGIKRNQLVCQAFYSVESTSCTPFAVQALDTGNAIRGSSQCCKQYTTHCMNEN